MKRKIMALMVCASTQGQAVELVVSAHQADPASSTGFTVFFGIFGTSGPFKNWIIRWPTEPVWARAV